MLKLQQANKEINSTRMKHVNSGVKITSVHKIKIIYSYMIVLIIKYPNLMKKGNSNHLIFTLDVKKRSFKVHERKIKELSENFNFDSLKIFFF